jgi:hypothetical protein
MCIFFVLVHYEKKRVQLPQESGEEICSRKLVLVPYERGERELGDYICTVIQQLQ